MIKNKKVIAIFLSVIMIISVISVYGGIIPNTGQDPLKFTDLEENPNIGYTVGLMYYDIWRRNDGSWTSDGAPNETHSSEYNYRLKFENRIVKSVKTYVFDDGNSKHMQIWNETRSIDYRDEVKDAVGENLRIVQAQPSGTGSDKVNIQVEASVKLSAPSPIETTKEWQGQNVIGLRYYIPIVIEVEFEPIDGQLFVKHYKTDGQALAEYNYEEVIEPTKEYTISKTSIDPLKYVGHKFSKGKPPESSQSIESGESVTFTYDGKDKNLYVYFYYEGEGEKPDPPEGGGESGEDLDPNATGVIKADNKGSEKFDVEDGIPTTEDLYTEVTTKDFLYKYAFQNVTGSKSYPITFQKTYNLTWEVDEGRYVTCHHDEDGWCTSECHDEWESNWVTKTEPQVVTQNYSIERIFAYWIINELQVYGLDKAEVENYALPSEKVTLRPSGYIEPSVTVVADTSEEAHIKEPEYQETVTLPSETVDGGRGGKPSPPSEDWSSMAEELIKPILVRNDELSVNGSTVMVGDWVEEKTSNPSSFPTTSMLDPEVLYKDGMEIEARKLNKEKAPSKGTVYYKLIESVGGGDGFKEGEIKNINPVTVHTPVVCYPSVYDDSSFNQKVDPETSRVSIILDRPSSIEIPTTGQHKSIKGYGNRDYEKYTEKKEVRFPFDIYKGTSKDTGTYIPKNTWIDVPLSYDSMNFYTPIWVDEGRYEIEFRAVSINAPSDTSYEHNANKDLRNYVAYDTIPVEVIGRMYAFKITDIEDYPTWQDVFRVSPDSLNHTRDYFTVGTSNQNGDHRQGATEQFTLPIINGSHPYKENIGAVPTGYKFKFELVTIGNLYNPYDYINITPTFHYINKDTGARQEVDLYYNESIEGETKYFVKVGSTTDKRNDKLMRLGDADRNVPSNEITATSFVLGVEEELLKNNKTRIGYFSQTILPEYVKMFIGDTSNIPSSVDPVKVKKSMQHWYGEYYLPSEVKAVPKDYDVFSYAKEHGLRGNENFWLENGYIMVNFKIDTVKDGLFQNPDLSYYDVPLGNMWEIEEDTEVKIDNMGVTHIIQNGDVFMYDLDRKASDDYKSGGTH